MYRAAGAVDPPQNLCQCRHLYLFHGTCRGREASAGRAIQAPHNLQRIYRGAGQRHSMLAASLHALGRYAPFGSLQVYLAPLGAPPRRCLSWRNSRMLSSSSSRTSDNSASVASRLVPSAWRIVPISPSSASRSSASVRRIASTSAAVAIVAPIQKAAPMTVAASAANAIHCSTRVTVGGLPSPARAPDVRGWTVMSRRSSEFVP